MKENIPNFWQNDVKFPNYWGIGHIPKMKKSPDYVEFAIGQ
jgi:hypothetical protein